MKAKLNQFLMMNLLMLVSHTIFAGAKIATSTQLIDFSPSTKIQYFSLHNHGNEKAFIKIDVKNVGDIGAKTGEIRDATKKEILTVPKKLILKPGQSRKIKILKRMKAGESDHFFRIYASTAPLPSKSQDLEDKEAVGLKLHVGIGTNTLVIVRPKTMAPNLKMEKTDKMLTVENTGNTTVKLQQIKQCDGEDCINYTSKMVFPSSKRTIYLKDSSRPINLTQNVAGNEKEHLVS